jgi:hypothetical protein
MVVLVVGGDAVAPQLDKHVAAPAHPQRVAEPVRHLGRDGRLVGQLKRKEPVALGAHDARERVRRRQLVGGCRRRLGRGLDCCALAGHGGEVVGGLCGEGVFWWWT